MRGVAANDRDRSKFRQHLFIDLPAPRIVIDKQDAQIAELGRQLGHRHGGVIAKEFAFHVERASFAHRAFDPDAAVHDVRQFRRNGKSQSGAAEAPRGRAVRLAE